MTGQQLDFFADMMIEIDHRDAELDRREAKIAERERKLAAEQAHDEWIEAQMRLYKDFLFKRHYGDAQHNHIFHSKRLTRDDDPKFGRYGLYDDLDGGH